MIKLKVKEAKSTLQKILGLIGKTTPESILINTRFGIHTFGMQFPIDIVILNRKFHVVVIKEKLTPNNLFFWNPKFNYILELPSGTVRLKKIKRGSKIRLNVIS